MPPSRAAQALALSLARCTWPASVIISGASRASTKAALPSCASPFFKIAERLCKRADKHGNGCLIHGNWHGNLVSFRLEMEFLADYMRLSRRNSREPCVISRGVIYWALCIRGCCPQIRLRDVARAGYPPGHVHSSRQAGSNQSAAGDRRRRRPAAAAPRLRQHRRVRSVPAVRRFPQRPARGLSRRLSLASASRHRNHHLCARGSVEHGDSLGQSRQRSAPATCSG